MGYGFAAGTRRILKRKHFRAKKKTFTRIISDDKKRSFFSHSSAKFHARPANEKKNDQDTFFLWEDAEFRLEDANFRWGDASPAFFKLF